MRCHGIAVTRVGNSGFALSGERLAASLPAYVLQSPGADVQGSDPLGIARSNGIGLTIQPWEAAPQEELASEPRPLARSNRTRS